MGTRIPAVSFCLWLLLSVAVFAQQEQPSPEPSPSSESAKTNDVSPGVTPKNSPKPDLTPDANGKLSQQQMQQLFRVVAAKDM